MSELKACVVCANKEAEAQCPHCHNRTEAQDPRIQEMIECVEYNEKIIRQKLDDARDDLNVQQEIILTNKHHTLRKILTELKQIANRDNELLEDKAQ